MKWPWMTRAKHVEGIRRMAGYVRALTTENDQLRSHVGSLQKAYDMEQALRRDEQWRRIKAEGLLAYKDDRVRQARELMLPYIVDEPPTMKRKAIPEGESGV